MNNVTKHRIIVLNASRGIKEYNNFQAVLVNLDIMIIVELQKIATNVHLLAKLGIKKI